MARDLRLRLKKEELHRLYLKEKKSLEDIARLYGVSRVAVWKYCLAEGLTRRSRSEARLEAQKKGKVPQDYLHINDQFFSKWSPEMAYVLGLIVTDGCISKAGTISLSINDGELLESVKAVMNSDHPIKYYGWQEGLYSFRFGRSKLVADLNRLGILSRKSLNVSFPNVPNDFLVDFIRGVFDGDGSVFFDMRSKNYPVISKFVSGSRDFIRKLEINLQRLGLPKRVIYQQKTKNSVCYMFKYGHKDSKKLFTILYKNTQDGLFLKRKYNKFLEGLNIN